MWDFLVRRREGAKRFAAVGFAMSIVGATGWVWSTATGGDPTLGAMFVVVGMLLLAIAGAVVARQRREG